MTSTVWLISLYIALQLIADVAAVKQVSLWGLAIPAGSLVFALTFTVRDLIHKRLGKSWAVATINAAAVMNVLLALCLWLAAKLPHPVWWENQAAFEVTLVYLPRITIASIVAEWISERLDTSLYSIYVKWFPVKYQWGRVLFSNLFAGPADSIVFGTLAFAGVFPFSALVSLVIGQTVFKWAIAVVSIPAIYLIRESEGA